jgi:hypothetical protein
MKGRLDDPSSSKDTAPELVDSQSIGEDAGDGGISDKQFEGKGRLYLVCHFALEIQRTGGRLDDLADAVKPRGQRQLVLERVREQNRFGDVARGPDAGRAVFRR